MAKRLQLRRGTTTEHDTFTGALGEVTVDTDKKTVVVHDGGTVGGTPLARVSEVPSLVPQATETAQGKVELATQAEVNTGTDTTKVVTPATLSGTFLQKTKNALNASGSAPVYACRAWVNFSGTGTVSIRSSGNVSSITDNGTGSYGINFTTSMPTADYCVTGFAGRGAVGVILTADSGTYGSNSTISANVQTRLLGGSVDTVDADYVSIAIIA